MENIITNQIPVVMEPTPQAGPAPQPQPVQIQPQQQPQQVPVAQAQPTAVPPVATTPATVENPNRQSFVLENKHLKSRAAQLTATVLGLGFLLFEIFVFLKSIKSLWDL